MHVSYWGNYSLCKFHVECNYSLCTYYIESKYSSCKFHNWESLLCARFMLSVITNGAPCKLRASTVCAQFMLRVITVCARFMIECYYSLCTSYDWRLLLLVHVCMAVYVCYLYICIFAYFTFLCHMAYCFFMGISIHICSCVWMVLSSYKCAVPV